MPSIEITGLAALFPVWGGFSQNAVAIAPGIFYFCAPRNTFRSHQNKKCRPPMADSILSGGELGIRTPGTCNSSTVFKTAAIDHSASSPRAKVQNRA
jgi:hypothetical protein